MIKPTRKTPFFVIVDNQKQLFFFFNVHHTLKKPKKTPFFVS